MGVDERALKAHKQKGGVIANIDLDLLDREGEAYVLNNLNMKGRVAEESEKEEEAVEKKKKSNATQPPSWPIPYYVLRGLRQQDDPIKDQMH